MIIYLKDFRISLPIWVIKGVEVMSSSHEVISVLRAEKKVSSYCTTQRHQKIYQILKGKGVYLLWTKYEAMVRDFLVEQYQAGENPTNAQIRGHLISTCQPPKKSSEGPNLKVGSTYTINCKVPRRFKEDY